MPRRLVLSPIKNLIPRSVLISPQEEEKLSTDKGLTFSGTFVIKFIIPPIASDPYKVEEGPLIISICSIKDCGIPVKPYTVDRPLTIGSPSIRTIVLAPSWPFM